MITVQVSVKLPTGHLDKSRQMACVPSVALAPIARGLGMIISIRTEANFKT